MMQALGPGGTAVITGAASGFGLEASRLAARRGMQVVMADVQADALEAAAAEIRALGAPVLPFRLDVSKAAEVDALGAATRQAFGVPTFVFNNAGVGGGGLVWEHSARDWEWVIGVNLMGVAHGVRVFTPMMLAAVQAGTEEAGARRLARDAALLLQAAQLRRHAPEAVFDSFCASRLNGAADVFGLLDASLPLEALVDRARPVEMEICA